MNTIHSIKSPVTLLLLTYLVTHAAVSAYPPDNAAILYYKAFMLLHESENVPAEVIRVGKSQQAKPNYVA